MTTIVYKLGGSLLELPGLAERLRRLFQYRLSFVADECSQVHRILVVGGGATADLVRQWDQLHRLGDESAHDLALEAMSLNSQLLAKILPESQLVKSRPLAAAALAASQIALISAAELVESEERATRECLPRSWNVTSDSIAAYLATRWPADALVLIKSVKWSGGADWRAAARDGLVDPYFPELATHIPYIGWVNLRDDGPFNPIWITRTIAH